MRLVAVAELPGERQMKIGAMLAATLSVSGCIVPRGVVVDEHVVAHGLLHDEGKPDEPRLYVSDDGHQVTVQLAAKRTCSDESYVIVEKTVGTTAAFAGGAGPREYTASDLLALPVAMITLSISAVVTGIIVAASDDSTTRDRRPIDRRSYPCAVVEAHQRITLELPSSEALTSETDDKGRAVFDVPTTDGVVIARADHVLPRSYRLGSNTRPRSWELTQAAAAAARAGDCASVRSAHEELRRTDAAFDAAVFMHEVAIARCVGEPAAYAAAQR